MRLRGTRLTAIANAARLVVAGYSPLSLFSASEPGVWYDPSDLSTLYQDPAGTTPVTAVEQPVGLMLDKSNGLVLGPELVTNGDFSDGTTGWTAGAGVGQSVVGGYLQVVAGSVFGSYQVVTTIAGKWYEVRGQIAMISGGTNARIRAESGTAPGPTPLASSSAVTSTTPTDVVCRFLATATSHAIYLRVETSGSVGRFDNISVREIPGYHAYQTTATSRPVLRQDGSGKHYLYFDGVDDFLVTPTITPGIDKAQVFAGVRKLRDAAYQAITELSTNPDETNQSFTFGASTATGDTSRRTWAFGSRGNASLALAGGAVYTAPITNVLAGIGDISGDSVILRVNGTQAASRTSDQGTGNYGNHPLYIGRRGGATAPFNGHLYSLIVRFGSNLPTATIVNTEKYINTKTRAY